MGFKLRLQLPLHNFYIGGNCELCDVVAENLKNLYIRNCNCVLQINKKKSTRDNEILSSD